MRNNFGYHSHKGVTKGMVPAPTPEEIASNVTDFSDMPSQHELPGCGPSDTMKTTHLQHRLNRGALIFLIMWNDCNL